MYLAECCLFLVSNFPGQLQPIISLLCSTFFSFWQMIPCFRVIFYIAYTLGCVRIGSHRQDLHPPPAATPLLFLEVLWQRPPPPPLFHFVPSTLTGVPLICSLFCAREVLVFSSVPTLARWGSKIQYSPFCFSLLEFPSLIRGC